MKEIVILSGKGGTGKTTVAAGLAGFGDKKILCDADVDSPNLHLLLKPVVRESHTFSGMWVPRIDRSRCTRCGLCLEFCRFGAIRSGQDSLLQIDPFRCEGCRLCERICPEGAIRSERSNRSKWFISDTRFGTLVHARMGAGEENSGKLVTRVRKKARELGREAGAGVILTDGPPGTGCPAIAAVTGADAALLVAEPSLSGLHDASRVIELLKGFGIPAYALINKHDLHPALTGKLEIQLRERGAEILGKIPFDREVVDAMAHGKTLPEQNPQSPISLLLEKSWKRLVP